MTPKRTEYGKAIRKDYEAGRISESRHNMTELVPRDDGIANTLTTVCKDNYLYNPATLRIRKLTPKECWRLMGFDDADFEKSGSREQQFATIQTGWKQHRCERAGSDFQ